MSDSNGGSITIGIGSVIGMILSWAKFHSVLSLIWPVIFGWFYVIYYLIEYGI